MKLADENAQLREQFEMKDAESAGLRGLVAGEFLGHVVDCLSDRGDTLVFPANRYATCARAMSMSARQR